MANYITNRIKMTGNQESINELKSFIINKDGQFDFNAIDPMPKELEMVAGGYDREFVQYYLKSLSKEEAENIKEQLKAVKCFFYDNYYEKFFSRDCRIDTDILKRMEKDVLESYPAVEDKTIIGVGKQYVDNVLKYGTDNWYDWCCEHWETKWNAWDTEVNGNEISFYTANTHVYKLVCMLAEMFPDVTIRYYFADEDFGYNCASWIICGDELIEEYIPEEGSEEAMDFAASVLGYDPRLEEDDESENEDEEFVIVEHPALKSA